MLVNIRDILLETSKSSAFWDMGWKHSLRWLLLFTPNEVHEWESTSVILPDPTSRFWHVTSRVSWACANTRQHVLTQCAQYGISEIML